MVKHKRAAICSATNTSGKQQLSQIMGAISWRQLPGQIRGPSIEMQLLAASGAQYDSVCVCVCVGREYLIRCPGCQAIVEKTREQITRKQ